MKTFKTINLFIFLAICCACNADCGIEDMSQIGPYSKESAAKYVLDMGDKYLCSKEFDRAALLYSSANLSLVGQTNLLSFRAEVSQLFAECTRDDNYMKLADGIHRIYSKYIKSCND